MLRQIEQQRSTPLPPRATEPLPPPLPMESMGGAKVKVDEFRFKGNSLLSDAQLAPAVAPFLKQALSFSDLQNAGVAVATLYRAAGWVVRVYLPEQDITGGTVTLQVVEAQFGAARVNGQPSRVSPERLKAIVDSAQKPGEPIRVDALDRALLLIADLPGVSAEGRLVEGRNVAETDLNLDVLDTALASGDMTVDNTGSRSTGSGRLAATLGLASPFGLGDQASAMLLHTQGSDYARAAYTAPIGYSGWRSGVNLSYLAYKVITPEFDALNARGSSTTFGAEANYPLLRSRLRNIYLRLSADSKRFDNRSGGATASRYSLRSVAATLTGNLYDDAAGGGATSGLLGLVQGNVDLANSPNQAADAASTRTAGSYSKLRYSASRQQTLSEAVSAYASLAGQLANKNLDSSERLYLGGFGGVRAYPASEAGGSEGTVVNLELRARLPLNFDFTGFYDWGTVLQNKRNDGAGAVTRNRINLQGAGFSVGWTASFGLVAKATLARRIGSNPNATASGLDQDGTLRRNRVWLQASLPF